MNILLIDFYDKLRATRWRQRHQHFARLYYVTDLDTATDQGPIPRGPDHRVAGAGARRLLVCLGFVHRSSGQSIVTARMTRTVELLACRAGLGVSKFDGFSGIFQGGFSDETFVEQVLVASQHRMSIIKGCLCLTQGLLSYRRLNLTQLPHSGLGLF